jgi:hypothetical protein
MHISGKNGTINGQGQVWWDKYHAKELQFTRGYLLELLYSDNIIISNVTFVDAPSWNLHPTYCTYGSELSTPTTSDLALSESDMVIRWCVCLICFRCAQQCDHQRRHHSRAGAFAKH